MAHTESISTKLGSPAPDFHLPATDGTNYSLESFKNAKGLTIVFTCNHCPYAKAAWPILIKLSEEFKEKGIEFVGINPNDETQYPEDSFDIMKQRVSDWKINFSYLRDESQQAARAYGAVCTPDIYVYDNNRKLYYRGRINNNWPPVEKTDDTWQTKQSTKETKEELKNALNLLLAGQLPPKNQSPSIGCSIKWKNRN